MGEMSDGRPGGRVSRRSALGMLGLGTAAMAAGTQAACAQDGQPFRIVIAFPPGGTSTASLTPLKEPLGAALGGPLEFEYKPGAGGNVAALYVIQSPPDGHTLLFGHAGPLAINHHLLVQTVFDAHRDLRPLAMIVQYPIVICVAAKYQVTTLKEFVDLARRNQLVVGSSGNGSIQHLAYETFSRAHELKMIHIPFAGGGPLQQAFERGALDVLFETGSNIVNHVRAGTLRALAVMGRERLSILPDVPTAAEAGLADLYVSAWFGLLAPVRTPDDVAARITDSTIRALAQPEVRNALNAIGGIPAAMGAQEFRRFIDVENERWGRIIRDPGPRSEQQPGGGASRSLGTPQ
jgi:tripartite-type tricarboxylate transporter receptor subunit TctC